MTEMIPYHQQQQTDYQAANAYLASLKSDAGRRGMLSQLRKVASILDAPDIDAVNWATLNAANVRAIVSRLTAENLAPASIATALNALKGVARAAWSAARWIPRPISASAAFAHQPAADYRLAAILTPASGWR